VPQRCRPAPPTDVEKKCTPRIENAVYFMKNEEGNAIITEGNAIITEANPIITESDFTSKSAVCIVGNNSVLFIVRLVL
jgi:hypothetical protein